MNTNGEEQQSEVDFWLNGLLRVFDTFLRFLWDATTHAGGEAFIIFIFLLPIILIGKFRLSQPIAILCLPISLTGFVMFSAAKFSLFRKGHRLTFGSSLMTPHYRTLYRLGYYLMTGSALLIFTIAVGRNIWGLAFLDYAYYACIGFMISCATAIAFIIWKVFLRGDCS